MNVQYRLDFNRMNANGGKECISSFLYQADLTVIDDGITTQLLFSERSHDIGDMWENAFSHLRDLERQMSINPASCSAIYDKMCDLRHSELFLTHGPVTSVGINLNC